MEDKKIKDEELKNVAGGDCEEPEEFNWREKGYQTPVKDQCDGEGLWKFEAVGDTDGYHKKNN